MKPKSQLDHAVFDWLRQLTAEPRGSDPVRSVPLAQLAPPPEALGDSPELKGSHLMESYRAMKDAGARGVWAVAANELEDVRTDLAALEKSLGHKSEPGRALLADAEAWGKAHHREMAQARAAGDRLERDPVFQALHKQENALDTQIEEQAQALHISGGVMGALAYCSGDPHHAATQLCGLKRQLDGVQSRIAHREAELR